MPPVYCSVWLHSIMTAFLRHGRHHHNRRPLHFLLLLVVGNRPDFLVYAKTVRWVAALQSSLRPFSIRCDDFLDNLRSRPKHALRDHSSTTTTITPCPAAATTTTITPTACRSMRPPHTPTRSAARRNYCRRVKLRELKSPQIINNDVCRWFSCDSSKTSNR